MFEGTNQMEADQEAVAAARVEFADLLDGLSNEQLVTETLCSGWTPKEVAGHLVSFVELSLPSMMFSMAKAGFNVDKAWDRNARTYGAAPVSEITAQLRANAAKPAPIKSFPAGVSVTDVTVHTQDVRRSLGIDAPANADRVRMALDFVTAHKKRKIMVKPERIDGLQLVATDLDWSWGSGPEASGTGEAVLLAIFGRSTYDELSGDGVDRLRG